MNPVAAILNNSMRKRADFVGADLAPGISSQNDDMLQKDLINGVNLGKAGKWPGLGMGLVVRLRNAVNEGANHESDEVRSLTNAFQDQATGRIAHLDEVQRFGLFGRGDEKDADYMASMKDLRSAINSYLTRFTAAKVRWAQQQAAQAQQATGPAPLQLLPGGLDPNQQQYYPQPGGYDPTLDQLLADEQARMQGGGQYAPPSDPGYSPAWGPDPMNSYTPSADPFMLDGVSGVVSKLASLLPHQQAAALVNTAGDDPQSDYLISELQRLADDQQYAYEISDGDGETALAVHGGAQEIVGYMEQQVKGRVFDIVGGEATGDRADLPSALLGLLPDFVMQAMTLVTQAAKGNSKAIATGKEIKKAAAEGDPAAQKASDALEVANVLLEAKKKSAKKKSLYEAGLS